MLILYFSKNNLFIVTPVPVTVDFDVIDVMASSSAATSVMDDIAIELVLLTGIGESQHLRYCHFVFQLVELVVPVLKSLEVQLRN